VDASSTAGFNTIDAVDVAGPVCSACEDGYSLSLRTAWTWTDTDPIIDNSVTTP